MKIFLLPTKGSFLTFAEYVFFLELSLHLSLVLCPLHELNKYLLIKEENKSLVDIKCSNKKLHTTSLTVFEVTPGIYSGTSALPEIV